MKNVKFLVPSWGALYDLDKPPSRTNAGAGIGTKYARIEDAGAGKRIMTTAELTPGDIVFADWLWFCEEGMTERAKAFLELPHAKAIYGSELAVLTYPLPIVKKLVEGVDIITHNTEYQRQLYEIVNIYNTRFLPDPIPESVFRYSVRHDKKRKENINSAWGQRRISSA